MKTKQVLSVEQMTHLQELGLDTSDASMCWCCFLGNIEEEWELEIYENVLNQRRDSTFWETTSTYTLQDILGLLPKEIKSNEDIFRLTMFVIGKMWTVCYSMSDEFDYYKEFSSVSLMDCAYDMLCWCIENGYVGKEGD